MDGNSLPEAATEKPLKITESCARRVRALREAEGNPALMLRLSVTGGGCAGFQYGFSLDDQRQPDDLLIEREDVGLLVDSTSLELLGGAEVDYVEDLVGSYFKVANPNASSSCGCGTSFSV